MSDELFDGDCCNLCGGTSHMSTAGVTGCPEFHYCQACLKTYGPRSTGKVVGVHAEYVRRRSLADAQRLVEGSPVAGCRFKVGDRVCSRFDAAKTATVAENKPGQVAVRWDTSPDIVGCFHDDHTFELIAAAPVEKAPVSAPTAEAYGWQSVSRLTEAADRKIAEALRAQLLPVVAQPCRHPRRFRSGICATCGHVGPGENDAGYAITGERETDAEAVARRARIDRIQAILSCPHSDVDYPRELCNRCGVTMKEFHCLRTHEPRERSNYGAGPLDVRIASARRSAVEGEAVRELARAPWDWPGVDEFEVVPRVRKIGDE